MGEEAKNVPKLECDYAKELVKKEVIILQLNELLP